MIERRTRYEEVFRAVYEPLQRYARRRTDPATADDVVADSLLVLWRRLDDVPDGLEVAWSYGVARRCLANHRRGEQRRESLVDRMMAERADPPPDTDPALDEALLELSADDRELVRLWAWEQLRPAEIALALGISPNAVSIRLHRAKARLLESLRRKEALATGHQGFGHTLTARKEAP